MSEGPSSVYSTSSCMGLEQPSCGVDSIMAVARRHCTSTMHQQAACSASWHQAAAGNPSLSPVIPHQI